MEGLPRQVRPYICLSCLRRWPARPGLAGQISKTFTQSRVLPQHAQRHASGEEKDAPHDVEAGEPRAEGRMSERLSQMTDASIEQGGKSAKKAVEEAGFSKELRQKLEARIQESSFKSENAAAFAELNMPSGAGKGTRDMATAQPWTGSESFSDAALRMLNDAHKPLRGTGSSKTPTPKGPPASVDLRMKKAIQRSQGERLANARDRISVYALSQDRTLSEQEREQMRKTMKERFTAGARPMPSSIQGLAVLANERIEDAIARGQFKNIARGKGKNVEKDHNANSPFLDTTEYFMNKIIQKQEIVPPWIEKQQELVKATNIFRGRLRAEWKRNAARVIASKGGSLETQILRAEAYAAAEAADNPKVPKVEAISAIDAEGRVSQVTVTETTAPADGSQDSKIFVTEARSTEAPAMTTAEPIASSNEGSSDSMPAPTSRVSPFRDPAWQSLEHSYHTLSITELNNLTRSYNLQAPDLAKKPYFSLDRELKVCFADVAPQLPDEIRERARRPEKIRVEVVSHRPGGVLERFSNEKVVVYDERKPQYGFKQFWKDLWRKEGEDAKA
ncbi:MAG: hypothetical protein Q9217_006283 [Psora testacea]